MLKIDVFNHVLPERFLKALPTPSLYVPNISKKGSAKSAGSEPLADRLALHDLDTRFRIMDRFDGYVQIICMAEPPVEDVGDGSSAVELARIANDEMAELLSKYPDRFIGAAACLPMNDIDAALRELDRAVRQLKFKGVQISSTIMDKPLDLSEFDPFFAKMNEYNLPILIHPRHKKSGARAYGFSPGESGLQERSTELLAAFPFNWTIETTLAMGCLVMGGVLNKYRNLKIVTHHLGGLAPYQANRIKRMQSFTPEERVKIGTDKSLYEWYQMMYGDTALWGNTAALLCGFEFFGPDHVLFGTDMPFGTRGGEAFVRDTIQSIEEANITVEARRKIYELNARKLFDIPV